jgi:hypothetical protein
MKIKMIIFLYIIVISLYKTNELLFNIFELIHFFELVNFTLILFISIILEHIQNFNFI